MIKRFGCLLLVLLLFGFASCKEVSVAASKDSEVRIDKYPFIASDARAEQIRSGTTKIIVGDPIEKARAVLSDPDEILPLFEPKIKNPKRIGSTYWYVIRRMSESGSVNEKDEQLVRISTDLSGRVTRVDYWGFEPDK